MACTIQLTQGLSAIVDEDDFPALSRFSWYAWKSNSGIFYARRSAKVNGKEVKIYMHRQILGLSEGDSREADHVSLNTLDDRREDLRISTHEQNCCNRKKPLSGSNRLKGASLMKTTGRWEAYITLNYRKIHLGYFDTQEEAHAVYWSAAKKLHGKFARRK